MHLHIVHITRHRYRGRAHASQNELRLRPLDDADQGCWAFQRTVVAVDDFAGEWIWRGFDPTNNLVVGKSDVKGTYSGAPTEDVEVDVRVLDVGVAPEAALR